MSITILESVLAIYILTTRCSQISHAGLTFLFTGTGSKAIKCSDKFTQIVENGLVLHYFKMLAKSSELQPVNRFVNA